MSLYHMPRKGILRMLWEDKVRTEKGSEKETSCQKPSTPAVLMVRWWWEKMWESKEYRQHFQVSFFLCKEEDTAVVLMAMMVAQGHGLYVCVYICKDTHKYVCMCVY